MNTFVATSFLALIMTTGITNAGGTRQEEEACTKDVTRFCRPLINQGDLTILSCLQQNRGRLKRACQQVLINRGV